MKQSTFSAQVANNLLTVLQGYTKSIRLLLVMFLTLTVTTNAWGATYSKITTLSALTTGDYVIVGYQKTSSYGRLISGTLNSKRLAYTSHYTSAPSSYTTTEATEIWHLEVTGTGDTRNVTIYNDNKEQYLNPGFAWSNSSTSWTVSYNNGFSFKSGTEYLGVNKSANYWRSYASSTLTNVNGIILLKAAASCTTPPTVSAAGSPSNITSTTATVSCTNGITSLGSAGCSIESYGFVYGTSSNPTISNTKEQVGTTYTTTGTAFSKGLTGLTANTTYYVRPYATNGNGTAYGTQTSFKTLELPKYTVTLDAGSGTCAASVTEASAGAGVTLPTPTLDGCDEWSFAGWKTTSAVTTETTTEPTLIPAGNYKPTANTTLYAVYQRTETTQGGGGTENETYAHSITSKTWSANGAQTLNSISWTLNNNGSYYGYDPTKGQQIGSGSSPATSMTLTTSGFASATKITAVRISTSGASSISGTVSVKVGSTAYTSGGSATKSLTTTNTEYEFTGSNTGNITISWSQTSSKAIYFKTIEVDYQTTGGGSSSTTYYHSTPDCGGSTPDPDPTYYTITLNPNYPDGEKGTFIDTVGNAVDGDLKISWLGETETTPIANLYSSISLNGYIFEGWYEITAEGEKNRKNTGTITSDTTFYARWKEPYTVTFEAGTGNCATESITETTANGITLPTATLTDCGDWVFLGWAEAAIASETTTPPASILAGGSTYKPTGNITLYAIYKRVEGGGGGEGPVATLTFDNTSKRTTLTTEQQVWTENNITLTNNKASSTSNIVDNSNPARFYKSSEIIISAPGAITKIVATTSGGEYTTALVNSVEGGGATSDGNTVTITPTASSNTYTIQLTGGQTRLYSITVTYGGGLSTSYYYSNPVCQTCENILTISKGAETNGTFTLDISGDIETCETEVSVLVKPTPANHYHIGSVTATTPTTGGAPTVTDNDNGTYTITYAANSTGASTINVTFAEDAKATITLYELGVPTTITTEYVGDKYTLPSTSSQSCGTKTLVGWSTVAFAETDTRPTENYYGISTQITLAETQTFYAVFAQSNGGGGGNGDYARVTEALDDWSGDYLIAYNDQTFANGSTGGTSGMGAEGNKQDLSLHINNNTIPANIGDLYNVTLVTVDGGYVLQTKDNKYNYQSSNANGLALTDNIETAKKYPLTVTFNNENDIAIAHSHGAIFHYNKNQTGYFRFYKDGGQEKVYLYKKSGTAATYTGYTTSCAVITGIEVDNPKTDFKQYDEFVFGGTVYAVDENDNRIDVTTSATFSGYDMKKAGTDTVTVTYLTHSTTYEITIEKVNAYALTWNVSGATNTGLSPAYVIPGNAIGKLPTPKEIPAGCDGKTFVGWTESNTVNLDGSEITFIKSTTVPSQATTYYAVFATPSGNAGDGDYVKVTEDANDLSGEYLIVYEDSEGSPTAPKAFNGELTTLDAASNTIAVTINDNTIASTDATDAAKFTIVKDGEGDYTIKSASGKYIGRTADDNKLDENESTPYKNTITFTDGNANIIGSGGAYLRYNKNSGAERFRYYKSTTYTQQQPIALYKKSGSSASYTDYTTGCQDVTITYYGFTGGYTTNCGGSDLNVIAQRVNSEHTIPNCGNITDPTTLGRTFLNLWKDQNGKEHKPGDSFIVTENITLYAQWKLETTDNIELPADKDDLATTDIVVNGGHTLTLPAGTTTINSLTLKGGLLGEDSKSGYAMPSVVIPEGATLVRKNTTINLDLVVNSDSWYPFAVPFAVANNGNIDYLDPVLKAASTYNTHFAIKTYDGENRAIVGTDQENNWDKVLQAAGLQPGKGYIISALTYPDKDTATIRIPMTVPNEWLTNGEQTTVNEVTRNQVTVIAHAGAAATEHQRHAGWNFVANPYLANFAGTNASGSFINGEIIINKGDYSYGGEDVPYVTIPTYNFAHYYQVKLSEATLSPAYSFFVQVGTDGTMTFDVAGRQAAPASIAARNAEERPVKMDVDITLSDNHSSDQTGIIISDRYSDAYEIGRDLEKLFGSAYNLSVYTLMADNTPLAFQALAIRSNMQVIPVGYRAPEQGEYTFRLNEATSSIDLLNEQYEQLVLVDYQTGELTNLLIADYTFYSERTQADNRFAIYAVPRQNAPTDLPNAIGQDKQAQKILHNGHLYILRDGNVYNGNGQIVK